MSTAREHEHDPDWEAIDGPLLIAGDARDLPLIVQVCRRLPWDAQGQVLVEVAARIQIRRIDVPDGVAVHWLVRGDLAQTRPRGSRLGEAVHAWCLEWTCGSPQLEWTLWLGPHTPTHVARMARSLLGVGAPPAS